MKKNLMVLGLSVALAAFAGAPAHAACSYTLQVPIGHSFDDFLGCYDGTRPAFYAFSLSTTAPDAGANSNGQLGVCSSADGTQQTGPGTPCIDPNAGVVGDNQVRIQYDWGSENPGAVGCPSNGNSTEGAEPVAFQVVDGHGKSIILTVGYDIGFGGYLVDHAFQVNATLDGVLNAFCDLSNAPIITSSSAGPSPSVSQVCTHLNVTSRLDTCDNNALGSLTGACVPGTTPPVTTGLGRLYTINAACGASPDLRLSAGWTLLPNQGSDVCNSITQATATGQCTFIGATGNLNGIETLAIAGALQVAGQAAANNLVKIDKASFIQSKLVVGFSTVNETSIVGFNVYAGSTKLNSGLVAAKGTGSNSYTFDSSRSDVKANKTVTVEGVLSDGSVVKSAPVSLK
jgi:hypothetical protein